MPIGKMISLKKVDRAISPNPIESAKADTFSAKKPPYLKNPRIDKFEIIEMERPNFR